MSTRGRKGATPASPAPVTTSSSTAAASPTPPSRSSRPTAGAGAGGAADRGRSKTPQRGKRRQSTESSNIASPIALPSPTAKPAYRQVTSGVGEDDDRHRFEKTLTTESYEATLKELALRNEKLENYAAYITTQFHLTLDAQMQDLRDKIDEGLAEASRAMLKSVNVETYQHPSESKGRKVFKPQESPLSKMLLYEDENYKTLFNIFAVCLLFWGISMALNDVEINGAPNHDLLIWGLVNDVYPFFLNLFLMWAASIIIIPLAHFWVEAKRRITRVLCCLAYFCILGTFCYYASHLVANRMAQFSIPMAFGFMAELARVCMKMHSYLREKLYWQHFKEEYACKPVSSGRWSWLDIAVPETQYFFGEVGKYVYFLFTPTLLFRERYPRTSRTRWEFVIRHFLEAVGIVYYAFLIFRTILPNFDHASSTEPIKLLDFVRLSFKCMGAGMATMFCAHYLVLHSTQTIGAEITRFADRGFYKDWWNSRTYSQFYRKWNGVVHDFIHCYLYTDMVELAGLNKRASLLLSFIISAIVHEYLICVSMGFFLPILGLLFTGPGLIFILLTKNKTGRIWNAFMWMTLAIGNGWLIVIYAREFYNREGPAPPGLEGTWEDFFVPRTMRVQFPGLFQKD